MKKKSVIALALLIPGIILFAQNQKESPDKKPLNNIYLSTFGVDVSMFSVNYERLFLVQPKFFLSGELGIGYNKVVHFIESFGFPAIYAYGDYLTIPHHITMNVGKRKSFFEFGIGGTAIIGCNAPEKYYLYPIIGYRLHPFISNKVNFRVYTTYPVDCIDNMLDILHGAGYENWGLWWFPVGVSIGIAF